MISLDEISKLSVAERIQLVEDIWDTISTTPDDVPVTDAQRAELDRRLALHRQDPQGRPWTEVVERLSQRP